MDLSSSRNFPRCSLHRMRQHNALVLSGVMGRMKGAGVLGSWINFCNLYDNAVHATNTQ